MQSTERNPMIPSPHKRLYNVLRAYGTDHALAMDAADAGILALPPDASVLRDARDAAAIRAFDMMASREPRPWSVRATSDVLPVHGPVTLYSVIDAAVDAMLSNGASAIMIRETLYAQHRYADRNELCERIAAGALCHLLTVGDWA